MLRCRIRRLAAALALALAAASIGAPSVSAASLSADDANASGNPAMIADVAAGAVEITLITGDKVVVDQARSGAVSLQPAERPNGPVEIDVVEVGGEVYVFPADVAQLLPDVLDQELFNVTRLAEYGYTDAIPVIIDHAGPAPRAAAAGLAATTTLSTVGATAATIDGTAWWGSGQATALAGVQRVWLDKPITATLDTSIGQIGAGQAWDAGYDGEGITVAVLDTGIDADHPDLAGQVVGEANFSDSHTVVDLHGHGTHVSGIAVGDGTASSGQYVGVAPAASLLSGKVLGDRGQGQESWLIAGMEWAAEQGADIINMSLGTDDPSDGTDPVSRAVNQLTAEHDVLFVVAAGNSGPDETTIGSPAAADKAVTVGSVDSRETLAGSSSRGPRLGDYAIKPDLTAPGVGITSAVPGGGHANASGTSMAAPHVAGAAAILSQADPELTIDELTSALATTAVPNPIHSVYEQGGGRLDVPAALEVPVFASPTSLNLGHFPYPQDPAAPPVEVELSFTNRTDEPITLALSLEVEDTSGRQLEEELTVEPSTLVVAADSAATATVTLDIAEVPLDLYGGYLVASDPDGAPVTRTSVGFHKEQERHMLTIEGIDREGLPARGVSSAHVIDLDDAGSTEPSGFRLVNGTATVAVTPGVYAIHSRLVTIDDAGWTQSRTFAAAPEVEVTEDTTVVLDAREAAGPITIETPGHETELWDWMTTAHFRSDANGGYFGVFSSSAPDPVYALEMEPVAIGEFEFSTRWRYLGDNVLYDLQLRHADEISGDLGLVADPDKLARVDNRYHGTAGHPMSTSRLIYSPGPWFGSAFAFHHDVTAGQEEVTYLVPGDMQYQTSLHAAGAGVQLIDALTTYDPGEHRQQDWLRGPLRPGVHSGTPHIPAAVTYRDGDELVVDMREWVDVDGHAGWPSHPTADSSQFRLYRDGDLVAEADWAEGEFAIGPDEAQLRLELDAARDAPWWETSTRTSTAWTVDSSPTEAPEALPLLELDYRTELDLSNTAPHPRDRRGPATLEITAGRQAEADAGAIAGARMWVSYDDGDTWRERPSRGGSGGNTFEFILEARAPGYSTGYASVRVEAWDVDDNRIEQEIIRAWQLPPR